ncbi:Fur family transcriptional regulator [Jeotgalibaca caeni]|uniref:Fur family transcriptional regulator n=1 Tax=Jeotgalibaca caeni TaxID=3028623 RepID=UPI00237D5705|nr:Fur family transcriptional regulator [Jeotgalibaca caeni]MDE1547891.1 Fur family transcriptional regulator [Jeotgalibaca caeni]
MSHAAILESIDRMKDHGLKHTKKREDLIKLFAHEDRYLTAKQVQQKLEDDYPSLSFDTIYRNLYAFVDIGILETTELHNEKMFRMTCLHDGHHHHHFICEKCSRTIQLQMCPMDFFEQQLKNCLLKSHRFEVFGICDQCAQTA